MSYQDEFPWGIAKIFVTVGSPERNGRKTVIDPNNPESVYAGLCDLMATTVSKLVFVPTENPRYEQWIAEVTARETRESFEEWLRAKGGN
jgi:hypothetical protein